MKRHAAQKEQKTVDASEKVCFHSLQNLWVIQGKVFGYLSEMFLELPCLGLVLEDSARFFLVVQLKLVFLFREAPSLFRSACD